MATNHPTVVQFVGPRKGVGYVSSCRGVTSHNQNGAGDAATFVLVDRKAHHCTPYAPLRAVPGHFREKPNEISPIFTHNGRIRATVITNVKGAHSIVRELDYGSVAESATRTGRQTSIYGATYRNW